MNVSLVIPAFNEEETLPLLRAQLSPVLDALPDYEFEIVIVDDHSRDDTPGAIERWARDDRRVRGIRLARNSGTHIAAAAGLEYCTGSCAILMSADLEDPPELIGTLLERWRAGHDVVWGERAATRGGSLFERVTSRVYWGLMRTLAFSDGHERGADVGLFDRKVIHALSQAREKNTSILSLIMWLGFRQTEIRYTKHQRVAGQSKWTLAKKVKLLIDSVVSFSSVPIRLTWITGALFLAAGAGWTLVASIAAALGVWTVSLVMTALLSVLLIGFGSTLTFMGILGEYLWRTFDEARSRPRYVIERVFGAAPSGFVPDNPPLTTGAHRSDSGSAASAGPVETPSGVLQ